MKPKTFDYLQYSLIKSTPHFHNVDKELKSLKKFLNQYNLKIKSAVDVGCGDGKVTKKIQKMLNLKKIDGLDINETLVKEALRNGVDAKIANMNNIKINKKYDLVICYGTLHHSENKEQTIKNLLKISSKYLLIVDLTVRSHWWHKITNNKFYRFDATSYKIFSRHEIVKLLEESNTKVIGTRTNISANFFHDRSFILAEKY